jgi:pimeloyl-ACP methyl ester carboxylesterase
MVSAEIAGWLDHRRSTATAQRKPGTIEELATRRGRMNPRLDRAWLERLVTTGGFESDDGWRWKIDPSMRFGGFGPWRPEWTLMRLPGLPMPFLGVLGREMEEMGWGTPPEKVLPYMPLDGRCEILEDVGHFVHIERPGLVADIVLDFIGDPGATPNGVGS